VVCLIGPRVSGPGLVRKRKSAEQGRIERSILRLKARSSRSRNKVLFRDNIKDNGQLMSHLEKRLQELTGKK
jgi:hypothetical protein